ncbi:MAG: Ig-like domain-containing protein [Paenibacillaceae bacterium]|nr:Ig-like domain-containing protein [Paenibacillaceae bacterium]
MAKWFRATMAVMLLLTGVFQAGAAFGATASVSKLVLSKTEATLAIGDSTSVSATAVLSDGTSSNVTLLTDWTSDDAAVATVYNGTIAAKGEGTATIVASYAGIPQSISVKVSKKVKALTKDKQSIDLRYGQTSTIALTAVYSDNSTENVSDVAEWSSVDESIASVVNGVVSAQGPGATSISASYGQKTVSIPVNVETVKRLEAGKKELSLLLDQEETIKLIATYPDGTSRDVAAEAEWASSDEDVADALAGVITAYGAGSATIYASYGSREVAIQVSVNETRRLDADAQSVFLRKGATKQIKLTATYPDGSTADITDTAKWSTNNGNVAYAAKGLITAYEAGTATITASYGDNTATILVDVDLPRRLELSETAISLHVGDSKTLKLTATFVDGTVEDITAKANWSSGNEDAAFVSSAGVVTAYAMGEAKVAASYGGKSASVTVNVDIPSKLAADVKKLALQPEDTKQIILLATYTDGHEEYITEKAEWSTSADGVATVSKGLVTAVASGTGSIVAKYGNRTLTIKTEVGQADLLEPDVSKLNLKSDETRQLTLMATDSLGVKHDVTRDAVWSIANAKVATVYKGFVSAVADGKTTITVQYGGKTATIPVEVGLFQKLEANKRFLTLKSGESGTIALTVTYTDGSKKDVTKEAEWKTNAYKIADVNGSGEVTAVSYGKATITASFGGSTVSIPVEIDTLKYLTTDVVSLNLAVGDKVQVIATATYTDESEQDVSKPALWSSSRILTAEAKDGLIKANGKGTATITVSYGGKKAKIVVTVK